MKKILTFIIIFTTTSFLYACHIEMIPPREMPIENINSIETFERLFNKPGEKSLTIKISMIEWYQLQEMKINYAQRFHGDLRIDDYVKADLYYEDDIGEFWIEHIGFRTRGNTSRVLIMNQDGNPNLSHFKISFKETFDLDRTSEAYQALRNRRVFGLEEIDLKYNGNRDQTYLNERFSMELMNRFDIFAQKTTLINLYIEIEGDKTFYGVYTLFEPIDEAFIRRRFDVEDEVGNLYKALWQQFGPASLQIPSTNAIGIKDASINYRPAYDLKTNKRTGTHLELNEFIRQINVLEGQQFKNYIEQHFDVDMFLRFLAATVLLGNPDDYRAMGNNYYLYHHPNNQRWTLIPYDFDHALGIGWDGAPVFQNYTIGADIYTWGNLNAHLLGLDEYAHPLSDKILSIETYQIRYEDYLLALIDEQNDLFNFSSFYTLYTHYKDLYDYHLDQALLSLRFGLRDIETYIENKRADVLNQVNFYRQNPELRP
jgi:spore coat protein H